MTTTLYAQQAHDSLIAYCARNQEQIDKDIRSVYGVQYPIDNIDRISLVLFDPFYRSRAIKAGAIIH